LVIFSSDEAGTPMPCCIAKISAQACEKRDFPPRVLGLRFNRKHHVSQPGLHKKQASIQGLAAMSFHELIARYRRWKSLHETIRELTQLDDHELNDLGIGRWRIADIARHGNG